MTNAKNKKQVVKEKKKKTRAPRRATRAKNRVPGDYARVLSQRNSTNSLALSISNPADNAALRFPTSDMARTSVAAFKYQHDMSVTTVQGAGSIKGFAPNSSTVVLVGQPGLSHSVYGPMSTEAKSDLGFRYVNDKLNQLDSDYWITKAPLGAGTHGLYARPNFAYPSKAYAPPSGSDYVPIGEAGGKTYVFMNKSDILVMLPGLASGSFDGTLDVQIVRHNVASGNEEIEVEKVVTLAGGLVVPIALFTAAESGFYSTICLGLTITGAITDLACRIELQRMNTQTGWTHRPCFDLYTGSNGDPEIGRSVRCNATSLLITNTTALLTRAGTILAGRLIGQDIWNVSYSALENCAEKYSGQAAQGSYTFMEFTQPREEFLSVCEGLASPQPRYMLDRNDFMHCINITVPTGTTNTYTVTLATHVEFRTDVARYQKGVSSHGFSELLHARALINSNPEWFYENPTHMERIYQFIRNGINATRRHAGPISGLASSVDPARAPLYALLAQMLGK